MRILHIHQDFPDGRPFPFTRAVENLINAAKSSSPKHEHFVVSVNRTSNPFKVSYRCFSNGVSLVYWAIPLPFIYAPLVYCWTRFLRFRLRRKPFDLIHAHKLTTEGLFAYFYANIVEKKYVVSVRGGSDSKNLQRFWDIEYLFVRIYSQASYVFWVSPWNKSSIEKRLGVKNSKSCVFPNICDIEQIPPEKVIALRKRYCIVLSYHQFQRKGIIPLLDAISTLRLEGNLIELDVIGGGPDKFLNIIQEAITKRNLAGQVKILGPLCHLDVLKYLARAKALLLPALNETFGMVYIEAIASGAPVMFMANTGIDGHFRQEQVGVRIESQDPNCIKEGISFLEENYEQLNRSVTNIALSGELERFSGKYIAKLYFKTVEGIAE